MSLSPNRPRVVVAGSLTRDRIEMGGEVGWRLGGVVWHAGATLARLGIETRVVTRCAVRDRSLVSALSELGVEVCWSPSLATTVFVNRYSKRDGAERSQAVEALAEPIATRAILEEAEGASLLYLGPLHPLDFAPDLAVGLRRARVPRVALDIQGYTRIVRAGRVRAGMSPALPALLASSAFVKASVPEARLVVGPLEPEALARALTGGGRREALVTAGAEGAWLSTGSEAVSFEPGVGAPATDPTGAGDICFAHYLAARLFGAEPERALHVAIEGRRKRLADPARHRVLGAPACGVSRSFVK